MESGGSVAPKERVNIVYESADQQGVEVELPLKLLLMGDFTLQAESTPVESRACIRIDQDNFNDVVKAHRLHLALSVPNHLSHQQQGDDATLLVKLKFDSIRDFDPDRVAMQIPELAKLLKVRQALVSLKGPLGNLPQFRRELQRIMQDDRQLATLRALLNEAEAQ